MPTGIDHRRLQDLVDHDGAQIVEVLPAREYEEEHLPGAISIPLKSFNSEAISQLDRDKPVIVYCWDDN